jgi:UDP-N-acetylmuramoylalanine--D-glutamate ligase
LTRAELFFNEIKRKKIVFIGAGVSHDELIMMFLKKGLSVTVADIKPRERLCGAADRFEQAGAGLSLGENYLDAVSDADIVFRTPGMYFNHPVLLKARESGIAVTSETEVFFDLCPCKTYAVTGSDGKTTTTSIIAEMLKRGGKTVHKGGNIGRALLPLIEEIKPTDVVVAELSSFQLQSMRTSPDAAVITNISPNHLDVHKSMDEYAGSKKNILLHQNAFGKAVLNGDDAYTEELSALVRGKTLFFSRERTLENGAFLSGEWLSFNDGGAARNIVKISDVKIPGVHNIENYLAAIAVLYGDVETEAMADTAREFGGVEHRIEFVRELNGVKYYNDSIATSPTRTIAGLYAFDRKLLLIAGGYDKNIPYEPLAKPVCERVKTLILLGDTADKIEKAVRDDPSFDGGGCEIIRVHTLEEAADKARAEAVPGDIVTLSPASASFDKYANFEERGRHFKDIVNGL